MLWLKTSLACWAWVCVYVFQCGYLFSSVLFFFFLVVVFSSSCSSLDTAIIFYTHAHIHLHYDEQKSLISALCAISLFGNWKARGKGRRLWRTRVSLLLLLPTQPCWSVTGNQIKAIKERVHALSNEKKERESDDRSWRKIEDDYLSGAFVKIDTLRW